MGLAYRVQCFESILPMISIRIYAKIVQHMKRLARASMLGTWIAGWAGLFAPIPLSHQADQAVYLQPILFNLATEIPPDLEKPKLDGSLLLPDLRTLPPSDLRIAHLAGDLRELRLANTVWNNGQGSLELSGEFNSATNQTRVRQNITTTDGSLREHPVGEFVWHLGHDHWHFQDFTLYELWSMKPNGELDEVVASSDKLSYCVIDTDPVDRNHPAFTQHRNYFDCGQKLQGLSVGWGDTYKSHLDGQALDITAIPDGYYALISSVNPEGILIEADYHNNRAVVLLEIQDNRLKIVTHKEASQADCRDNCWN